MYDFPGERDGAATTVQHSGSRLPIIDYGLHPAYGGMFEPDEALRARAVAVLQPIVHEMQEIEAWKTRTFGYRYGHDDATGEQLARTGLFRFDLPARLMSPICRACEPILARIKAQVETMRAAGEAVHFKDRMQAITASTHADQWSMIETMLHEVGAYSLTARYFGGRGAKLKAISVLLSQPELKGSTPQLLPERGAPPTEGLHIDSAGVCILKGVLYLDDVGPDQGPFGLVPGSHRWEEGSPGRVFRRAFDRSGLVARGIKERRMFLSLPRQMQVKAEFGGDMMPDWPQTQALLRQESVSLGGRGLFSLFDPEAIHRGGQARTGERRAILITLRSRW